MLDFVFANAFPILSFIAMLVIIAAFMLAGQRLRVDSVQVFGVSIEERIATITFETQPMTTSARQVVSPISVILKDTQGIPLQGVNITAGLHDSDTLLGGSLSLVTDADGIARFMDLTINRTGRYKLKIRAGKIYELSDEFHIIPPGLAINFVDEEFGTDAYIGKLHRALSQTRMQEDVIKYNGDDIDA